MAAFDSHLVTELGAACEHFDRLRAGELAEQIALAIRESKLPYPAALAHAALKPLRRKRFFDAALHLADAVLESGQNDPLIRVAYAQALIDTGRLAAAVPFIESLVASTTPGSHARNESLGLLGRTYKQLYVGAGEGGGGEKWARSDYLLRAFNAYYDAWLGDASLSWHAINAIALLHRAKRDGVRLPPVAAFEQRIYEEMRAQVENGAADEWGLATAGEAAIALGDYESAKKWYAAYASGDPARIDAFEIASSLRQLEEVWQLTDDEPPGTEILPLLRAVLLERNGGAVRFDADSVTRKLQAARQAGLEKTFGDERVKTIKWYTTGLERCRPICRIERLDEKPQGTGFLVDGEAFHPSLRGETLLLTNYHVLSYDHPLAIPPEKALARFEALDREKTYRLAEEIVWADRDLDASLVRFQGKPPSRVAVVPLAGDWPRRAKDQPPPLPRVYVIGHPLGGPMAISLYDNELLASDGNRLHYRAPTEPGSSGSPVFDEDWNLVGLHHFGDWNIKSLFGDDATYDANEAYWIGAIISRCAAAQIKRSAPPRPRSSRRSTRAGKASRPRR